MSAYARFQEPQDYGRNLLRIWGYYKLGPIVFIEEKQCGSFADLDELNNSAYWAEYEVEICKGSDPRILGVVLESFDTKTKQLAHVPHTDALEADAEDYLRQDRDRFAKMREWLLEYGEREYKREAA